MQCPVSEGECAAIIQRPRWRYTAIVLRVRYTMSGIEMRVMPLPDADRMRPLDESGVPLYQVNSVIVLHPRKAMLYLSDEESGTDVPYQDGDCTLTPSAEGSCCDRKHWWKVPVRVATNGSAMPSPGKEYDNYPIEFDLHLICAFGDRGQGLGLKLGGWGWGYGNQDCKLRVQGQVVERSGSEVCRVSSLGRAGAHLCVDPMLDASICWPRGVDAFCRGWNVQGGRLRPRQLHGRGASG
eukprot:52085-Rhodomonas_salina.6